MGSLDYTWEKLFGAVHALSTGRGGLKERLEAACTSHLQRLFRPPNQIQEDIRERLQLIQKAVTAAEPQSESVGRIRESIQQMTEEEAAKVAEEIVSLLNTVALKAAARTKS